MAMRYWLRRIWRFILLLTALSILLLLLFRSRYNQVILDLAKTQVTNSTSDLINDAVAEQIGHAVGQRARFAAACARQNQHGTVKRFGSLALHGIECV